MSAMASTSTSTASSSSKPFQQWTVKELTDFLRQRGVTITGYNKPKLVQLATAVADIALPRDPDLASFDSARSRREKLQRAGCLFDDPIKLTGYTENFEHIPDFGLYDIFNYLIVNRTILNNSLSIFYTFPGSSWVWGTGWKTHRSCGVCLRTVNHYYKCRNSNACLPFLRYFIGFRKRKSKSYHARLRRTIFILIISSDGGKEVVLNEVYENDDRLFFSFSPRRHVQSVCSRSIADTVHGLFARA